MRKLRLKEIFTKIGSGATPRGGESVYIASGVALIRSQNIYNDRFKWDGLAYIRPEHAAELDGVEIQAGDVLLNITGDSVARVNRAPVEVLPARVNQHVAVIRPRADSLDSRYLHYMLASPLTQDCLYGLASSGGTRQALTKRMIEEFEVLIPDLRAQRAVANVLGTLDDKIELNRRANLALEDLVAALFRSWFIDFDPVVAKAAGRKPAHLHPGIAALFPAAFYNSEFGEIPTGWTFRSLGEIIKVKHGCAFAGEFFSEEPNGDILLTPGNFTIGGGFKDEKLKYYTGPVPEEYVLNEGDLVLSMTDLSKDGDTLGYPALIPSPPENHRYLHNQRLGKVVITPPGAANSLFLYQVFCGGDYRREVLASATGTTVKHTAPTRIEAFATVFPPSPLMSQFERTAKPLYRQIAQNRTESIALSKLRNTLLPKLLTGDLRVKNAEKLVEARL